MKKYLLLTLLIVGSVLALNMIFASSVLAAIKVSPSPWSDTTGTSPQDPAESGLDTEVPKPSTAASAAAKTSPAAVAAPEIKTGPALPTALPKLKLPNYLKFDSIITFAKDTLPQLMTYVGAVLFVVSFIAAGFLYLTAGANEEQTGKAKMALLGGVVGIVLVVLGQLIVNYVASFLFY